MENADREIRVCSLYERSLYLEICIKWTGQPRRHLLTTGWSTFVTSKRLVAGDSFVFLRYF